MTQQIVQLVDKNGNDIFPVSAGNGQVKIGETLSQPTSVEYVDTDNIIDGAVTTTKINDGAVTANKIDFTTLGENYSLDEQDTGFTWLNGETIYKKTITIGALPNSATKTVAHGISNLSGVIKIEGIVFDPRTSIWLPLPLVYEGDSSGYNVSVYVSTTLVAVKSTSDRSMLTPAYVTLYYTKSS